MMKNFMLKKALPVLLTMLIVAVAFFTAGAGFTEVVGLAFNTIIIAMIYMLVSDAESRIEFDYANKKTLAKTDRKLVNWKYWVGIVVMFAGVYFLTRFTVLKGWNVWLDGLIAVVLFIAGGIWLVKVYSPSVLGSEAFFRYNLKKHASKYEKALESGDRDAGIHELEYILPGRCVGNSLAGGVDWNNLFNASGMRYIDLIRSGVRHNIEVAEAVVYPYLGLVYDTDAKNGYNYKETK